MTEEYFKANDLITEGEIETLTVAEIKKLKVESMLDVVKN